jgi:hypothetical protein
MERLQQYCKAMYPCMRDIMRFTERSGQLFMRALSRTFMVVEYNGEWYSVETDDNNVPLSCSRLMYNVSWLEVHFAEWYPQTGRQFSTRFPAISRHFHMIDCRSYIILCVAGRPVLSVAEYGVVTAFADADDLENFLRQIERDAAYKKIILRALPLCISREIEHYF